MKYIDALTTDIEKKIKSIESCPFIEAEFGAMEKREGKIQAYKEILFIIDSLQQEESTEVDLEEEITNWLDPDGITDPTCYSYSAGDMEVTARHFFELGLKAQKGE